MGGSSVTITGPRHGRGGEEGGEEWYAGHGQSFQVGLNVIRPAAWWRISVSGGAEVLEEPPRLRADDDVVTNAGRRRRRSRGARL